MMKNMKKELDLIFDEVSSHKVNTLMLRNIEYMLKVRGLLKPNMTKEFRGSFADEMLFFLDVYKNYTKEDSVEILSQIYVWHDLNKK
jgi:hypothetical protein